MVTKNGGKTRSVDATDFFENTVRAYALIVELLAWSVRLEVPGI